ncbi:MAG: primase [Clostridiales bacterium]|nr:primase [Clostridiales bacterium]
MAQFYPEEIIQEVRANNDIVEIISDYVKLKRSGNTLKGLCPFHREKTPSFSVSPDKQLFHCFGCGVGGTVINFIMMIENLDFVEAIKFLAERARMTLPEGDFHGDHTKRYKQKQLILKINVEAAKFYYKNLLSHEGEIARKYLAKRRIKRKTITNFGLGYALNSWDSLLQYLLSKGYTIEEILSTGLIINSKGKSHYDRFRNRIIFPIIDLRGNVVGFGGRVLDDSLPKYLNSPETIVFNKSNTVYGMNFAKNAINNELIIVEGYMDVISLHQNGIINTVASLGTALTEEQAKIIKKYCQKAIIAYDADTAGQAATIRGMDILSKVGCKVNVLTLPEGKDPDEFIRIRGVERFQKTLKESKNLVEYKIELLKQKYDIDDIQQKVEFINEMAEIFAKIENSIECDAYVQKIAEETNINAQAIFAEMKKIKYRNNRKNNKSLEKINKNVNFVAGQTNANTNSKANIRLLNAEKMLINVLCYDKYVFNKVKELIQPSDFYNALHQKVASIIYHLREQGETIDPTEIVSKFENGEVSIVTSILHLDTNFEDNLKAAYELIDSINKEKNIQKIKSSLEEGNVEKLNTLLIEYKRK